MRRRKLISLGILVLATVVIASFMVMQASAQLNQSRVCNDCHPLDVTVNMTVTPTTSTTTTQTYSVSGHTSYDEVEGWSVFLGTTATGKYAAGAGSFTLNKDAQTYTVWWVDDDNTVGGGKGGSAKTNITTPSPPAGDTTSPTNPTNLTATAVSSSQINLAWTASTDNVAVAGYEIWRSPDNLTFAQVATSPTNSYSDTGLTASTIYYYQVRAYDASTNKSGYSNTANATTQAPPPPPPSGAYSQVIGTPHDLSTAITSPCQYCHAPHNASGDYLWARPIGTTYSGIKALCWSCHDGGVTPYGGYAFNTVLYSQHPVTPGTPGADCDRCHNPHNDTYGWFLKFATGANLCNDCHSGDIGMISHPVDADSLAKGIVPTDQSFNPNTGDFSGTDLFNSAGTAEVHWTTPIPTSGGYVKCLTCHTAHAGVAGSRLNTMQYAVNAAICLNCHK